MRTRGQPTLDRKCSIEGCDGAFLAKGVCRKHYSRLRKHGNADFVTWRKGQNRNRHPLYSTYIHMKERILSDNYKQRADYSGRGITICDRWLGIDGFTNFVEDMGPKPSPQHSLNRIDNDGNYEPSNCEWATSSQQNLNKRTPKNNKSGHKGVCWDRRSGTWLAYFRNRNLGYFNSIGDAIKARKFAEDNYLEGGR